MYIVHYIIKGSTTQHWKMFSDYTQCWDFMEMQDNPIKIIKFDPTCPEPQVIWWGTESYAKELDTSREYGRSLTLDVNKTKKNELELIYEDICEQISAFSSGLREQVRRMFK